VTPTPLSGISEEQRIVGAWDAAGIWARAVAVRDRLPEIPLLEDKLPGIEAALARECSFLLMARGENGRALAFSIVVPHEDILEVLYLAVDPSAWGNGLARRLLDYLRHHSVTTKIPMELWVIADKTRAISTYESAGWSATSEVKIRNSGGRPERRFTLSPQNLPTAV